MVVGSLIKNLGGGLAPTGGYVCGRKECIERCAYRLSAPGLGREVGANLGLLTSFYQGLFLRPRWCPPQCGARCLPPGAMRSWASG